MKMQKRKFRIGELAQELQVERFVIRFWEKEFLIKATRSEGGQRFYNEKDLEKFKQIKELLYDKGFTIAGARKQLKGKHSITSLQTTIIASHKTTLDPEEVSSAQLDKTTIKQQIVQLQKRLIQLRELL